MVSSSASALLRLAGWSYVPDFAARQALSFLHGFLRSRSYPVPAPRTPQWVKHYRYMFAFVVLGFLSYNLIEASRSTPSNFYEVLGVTPSADADALKSAFRSFAKRNHPDRVGRQGEELFIVVRDAFESLKDPTTRFAYDRFGPDAMTWQDCSTPKEFLRKGLLQALGFYIGTGLILLFMSVVLKPSPVSFWRYLLLLGLFASELSFLLGVGSSSILNLLFPNRVPFQHAVFLHQIFVFLSVAISRVAPVLFPDDLSQIRPEDPRTYAPLIERLAAVSALMDREISRMLHTDLHSMHGTGHSSDFGDIVPCEPSDEVMDQLTKEMEQMIIEHHLRTQGPIQPLWKSAVERKQRDLLDRTKISPAPRRRGSGGAPPGDTSMDPAHLSNFFDGHEHQPHVLDDVNRDMAAQCGRATSPSQNDEDGLPSPPGSVSPVEQPRHLKEEVNSPQLRWTSHSPLRVHSPTSSPHRLPPSPRQSHSPPPSLLRTDD